MKRKEHSFISCLCWHVWKPKILRVFFSHPICWEFKELFVRWNYNGERKIHMWYPQGYWLGGLKLSLGMSWLNKEDFLVWRKRNVIKILMYTSDDGGQYVVLWVQWGHKFHPLFSFHLDNFIPIPSSPICISGSKSFPLVRDTLISEFTCLLMQSTLTWAPILRRKSCV